MQAAKLVCVDFETALIFPDGRTEASVQAHLPDFRILSCAFTWMENDKMVSDFVQGEDLVREKLKILESSQAELLAHNISFEMHVSMCRFPDLNLNWAYDTMRLVQNWDNGGDKYAFETIILEGETDEDIEIKKAPLSGLGLVVSLKRVFGNEYVDHKERAYNWIKENVPEAKGKKPGLFLDRLPADEMRIYNIGDTEQTLRLYNEITRQFASINYDWRPDHQLYLSTVRLVNGSKYRGVSVDRGSLSTNREIVFKQIAKITDEFFSSFGVEIKSVERDKLELYCSKPKTEKGRTKRREKCIPDSEIWNKNIRFNEGSNKQLAELFIGKLGIQPKFFTKKGQPSFKSSLLNQWGRGGEILLTRRKRLIVLKQMDALLEVSSYDGRWRIDLKVASTSTGRMSGGTH